MYIKNVFMLIVLEELERLLGERPEKLKSLGAHFSLPSSHTHSQPLRVAMHPAYGHQPVHDTSVPHQQSLYNPLPSQTVIPPPPYLSPDPLSFSYFPPVTHQPSVGHPSSPRTGCLDSPLPAHTPPSYSTALQAGHSTTASMQELLLDGEISNDVDALNPSLTDLQLHGKIEFETLAMFVAVELLCCSWLVLCLCLKGNFGKS